MFTGVEAVTLVGCFLASNTATFSGGGLYHSAALDAGAGLLWTSTAYGLPTHTACDVIR